MLAESSTARRIDTNDIIDKVDLVALIAQAISLKKQGQEYAGCCPFHEERTASFVVSAVKKFYFCFGCGAKGNAIGWMMDYHRKSFIEACQTLAGDALPKLSANNEIKKKPANIEYSPKWLALLPVPRSAPSLLDKNNRTVPIWNPKSGKFWTIQYTRADAYLDADGQLLGYVLRTEFGDKKVTPTVTYCVGPSGVQQWCVGGFPRPRPLCGLDALAARPDAHVLVVEGEKCREAGAGALPQYVVVAWPGGSKGIGHVDWTPLKNRQCVLWPDADEAGWHAMLGWQERSGIRHIGVAQHLFRIGAQSVRLIDTKGQPKGWDIADALDPEQDAWTPRQLAGWAANRVVALEYVQENGQGIH